MFRRGEKVVFLELPDFLILLGKGKWVISAEEDPILRHLR